MMNRITWHHTGGGHFPNPVDLRAYHRLLDADGMVHTGTFPISANAGRLRRGAYAAHTLGVNSGNIGVSVCAMGGSKWGDPFSARSFPTSVQIDAMLRLTADLCEEYGIDPKPDFVLSHAEVEQRLGVQQRNKWDFDYHPRGTRKTRNALAIGDELRTELRNMLGGKKIRPPRVVRSTLRRGARGRQVVELQRLLRMNNIDGMFGPATMAAVKAFQAANELRPDGIVGPMTWAALE